MKIAEMFDLIMGPKFPQESPLSAQLGGSAHFSSSCRSRALVRTLIDPGQDARGTLHVAAVILPKSLDHHRLPAPHAQEKERPPNDQARWPRTPVRDEKELRPTP